MLINTCHWCYIIWLTTLTKAEFVVVDTIISIFKIYQIIDQDYKKVPKRAMLDFVLTPSGVNPTPKINTASLTPAWCCIFNTSVFDAMIF